MRGLKHRLNGFRGRLVMAGLILTLAASMASATVVVKMELPQMVNVSDSIIQGVVSKVETKWDADKKMVFTYATIHVEDKLKGDKGQEVTIRQEGGKVGAMNVFVSGTPNFKVGEEVIVFLTGDKLGSYQVVGLNQGKYQIVGNQAVSTMSGLEVLNQKTGQIEDPRATSVSSVDALKAQIRGLVK